ncbi:hypothetical protein V1224_00910 [Lachnospiraceae bacterium JLR.KK008]
MRLAENQSQSLKNKQTRIIKRTIKDSVFTNLFQDKKYLIQLYKALHPEDTDVTGEDLTDVTIRNILTDSLYNDLGFMVGNRLILLVEAQSTWTVNIIVRAFLYLSQTCHDYLKRTKQNLYKGKKVQLPLPEIYVIYTGSRKERPSQVSLTEEFFHGQECCLEVKVKMIYDGKKGDIINQYVSFTQVCNAQIALYGRTQKAISETIRICKDRNVLKEYLESREKEVVDIMMVLYEEEEIMRSYLESLENEMEEARQTATQQGLQQGIQQGIQKGLQQGIYTAGIKTAKRLLQMGKLSLEEIADGTGLSVEEVKQLTKQ